MLGSSCIALFGLPAGDMVRFLVKDQMTFQKKNGRTCDHLQFLKPDKSAQANQTNATKMQAY